MAERKVRKTLGLGLGLVSLSFIFYFIPDFMAVIDLTPDFIGYILLVAGLTALSDMNESIASARRIFIRMILFGILKIVAFVAAFTLSDGFEQPTTLLLFGFVLAVAECLLLIPAYRDLFDGVLYLGMREGGTAVFDYGKHRRKNVTERMRISTVRFIIIKNLCVLLPEMLSLSVNDGLDAYNYSFSSEINVFRAIGFVIALVFGIIWLVKIEKYFSKIKKDEIFMKNLVEKYRVEILPKTSIFLCRRLKLGLILLGIGTIFALDIYIGGNDGFSILPDALFAAFYIAGAVVLSVKNRKLGVISASVSAVYGIFTTIMWKLNYDFSYKYTPRQAALDENVNNMWKWLVAGSVFETLLFLASFALVTMIVLNIIKENTGYVSPRMSATPDARAEEVHKSLKKRVIVAIAFAVIAAAFTPFRVIMFTSSSYIADVSWIAEAVATAAFAAAMLVALYNVNFEIQEKYLTD